MHPEPLDRRPSFAALLLFLALNTAAYVAIVVVLFSLAGCTPAPDCRSECDAVCGGSVNVERCIVGSGCHAVCKEGR